MRAAPIDIDFAGELRAYHSRRTRNRPGGRHLSDVVSRIVNQIEPGRYGSDPIDPVLAHQGFVFEDLLSMVFARQLGMKQTEVEKDRIIGTLDGFRTPAGCRSTPRPSNRGRVQEAKFTKMSAGNQITSATFQPWMIRTAGYCYMMGTTEAELIVHFNNGRYELGGGRFGDAIVRGWYLEWTVQELRDNWRWILRTANEMDEEEVEQEHRVEGRAPQS